MSDYIDLPTEIHVLIFRCLQAISSGPRYQLYPQNFEGKTPEEKSCKSWQCFFHPHIPHDFCVQPKDLDTGSTTRRWREGEHIFQRSPGHDYRLCWRLIDPGAFYLAFTCRKLFKIYLSNSVANNLVLEAPDLKKCIIPGYVYNTFWKGYDCSDACSTLRGGLLARLNRVKEGQRGSPLTRFTLDCQTLELPPEFYTRVFETVNEVFGNQLMVVIVNCGELAFGETFQLFNAMGPQQAQELEAFENPLIKERSAHNLQCPDILQNHDNPPLTLHIHVGGNDCGGYSLYSLYWHSAVTAFYERNIKCAYTTFSRLRTYTGDLSAIFSDLFPKGLKPLETDKIRCILTPKWTFHTKQRFGEIDPE